MSKGTKRKQKLEHSNQPNQKLKFEPVNKTCHFEKQAEHEKKKLKKQRNKIYYEKRKMKKKQDKLQQENFETCHFENQAEREKRNSENNKINFTMKKEKMKKKQDKLKQQNLMNNRVKNAYDMKDKGDKTSLTTTYEADFAKPHNTLPPDSNNTSALKKHPQQVSTQ